MIDCMLQRRVAGSRNNAVSRTWRMRKYPGDQRAPTAATATVIAIACDHFRRLPT
jgi:hypothetical protein